MSRARYYISFDNVTWSEFFPTNTPVVKWQPEGEEMFMRPKVDTFKIGRTRNEAVYDDLYNMFFDYNYFGTDIYYKINVLGTDKFYFIQPINFGTMDSQNRVFECTPDPNDSYRDLMMLYEKQYPSPYFFGLSNTIYNPRRDTGVFTNINFTTFTNITSCIWSSDGSNIKTARNGLPVATYNGDYVTFVVPVFAGTAFTIQLVNAGGTARSATATVNAAGKYVLTQNADDTVLVEMKYSTLAAANGAFTYRIYYPVNNGAGDTLYNILDACINGASFMDLTLDIVSTYLWNDALPTGHAVDTPNISTYITANPTNDYVVSGAAIWNDLWLCRTDTFTTDYNNDFSTSLKEIMDILKIIRAYWFIDPDGKFRIEHEKYFRDFVAQADLTSATYTGDKPEVDVRRYRYASNELFNQVNYKANNESNFGFIDFPTNFDPKQTNIAVKEVSTTASFDIENIDSNPDNASNTGLTLLRTISMGGKVYVDIDDTEYVSTITTYYPNGKLAWSYLCKYYFGYFAEALTGTINQQEVAKTFDHVREFLKQEGIKFRMATALDWKKPFTVAEGTGWLTSAEYNPETGMYKIAVGLNPYALTLYIVDSDDETIHITDDGGDLLTT